jgi:hypothetical protein
MRWDGQLSVIEERCTSMLTSCLFNKKDALGWSEACPSKGCISMDSCLFRKKMHRGAQLSVLKEGCIGIDSCLVRKQIHRDGQFMFFRSRRGWKTGFSDKLADFYSLCVREHKLAN